MLRSEIPLVRVQREYKGQEDAVEKVRVEDVRLDPRELLDHINGVVLTQPDESSKVEELVLEAVGARVQVRCSKFAVFMLRSSSYE